MVVPTAALWVKASASAALSNSLVEASWPSNPARSVPEAFAIASLAALPSAPSAFIFAMVSYQMPTSALPKSGLSFSTAVLTTIRSMISPGICEESNTFLASGEPRISETIGFHVTTAVTSDVL